MFSKIMLNNSHNNNMLNSNTFNSNNYDSQYDIPPPRMNDENYKKMLKKLAKGDIEGCFKKGMKYLLKF